MASTCRLAAAERRGYSTGTGGGCAVPDEPCAVSKGKCGGPSRSCPKSFRPAMLIAYTILCNRCQYFYPPTSFSSSPGGYSVERCRVNEAIPGGCLLLPWRFAPQVVGRCERLTTKQSLTKHTMICIPKREREVPEK
jgi:hypothetical protein